MSQIPFDPRMADAVSADRSFPAASSIDRIPAHEIVRADVVKSLGNDLFAINVRGTQVAAYTTLPLRPGQRVDVEVLRDAVGGATRFRVLERDASIPAAAVSAGSRQLADSPAGSAVSQTSQPPPANSSDNGIRAGGVVASLIAARPDLAQRVQSLLGAFAGRPSGLGGGIEDLAGQIRDLVRSSPNAAARLIDASGLLDQLMGEELLSDPELLADALAGRVPKLARGLEGSLARAAVLLSTAEGKLATAEHGGQAQESGDLSQANIVARALGARLDARLTSARIGSPDAKPSPPRVFPASDSASVESSPIGSRQLGPPPTESTTPRAPSEIAVTADPAAGERSRASADHPSLIRGEFEGDLKGQLLELRARLAQLADDPAQSAVRPNVDRAIGRTDVLLDQITGQQLRNVDGLNRYIHVELPMDSRSGIEEARLQVFYRQRERGNQESESSDRFTIAIFLKLSRLGDVLATVTGVDRSVSVAFTAAEGAATQLLEASSDELRTALAASGHAGAMVSIRPTRSARPRASLDDGESLWSEFVNEAPNRSTPGGRLDFRT